MIFWAARWLGIDRRLAAVLGVGGAVCGVSAAIAIAGAVGAKKEDAPIAITTVILWAIVMIFVLPVVAHLLHLPAGVAGAWIGTSEFADAAGIAAAEAYGQIAGHDGIAGTADQSVWAFTLMKVVGRDVWIGIWAFVLAIVATTRWDRQEFGAKPNPAEIWWRFPKFVIGFLVASILITVAARSYSMTNYNKVVVPALVGPLKDLRSWAFIFCFLSIGLTTRFRDLAARGREALPGLQHRRPGQCRAWLRALGRGFRQLLGKPDPVSVLRRALDATGGPCRPPTEPADAGGSTSVNAAACAACRHFRDDPADIEAALPGLSVLSSGYASVRGQDGLCLKHDRFVTRGVELPGVRGAGPGNSGGAKCSSAPTRRMTELSNRS